jgi:hypothetical protein
MSIHQTIIKSLNHQIYYLASKIFILIYFDSFIYSFSRQTQRPQLLHDRFQLLHDRPADPGNYFLAKPGLLAITADLHSCKRE